MATRVGATTVEVKSSHAVMVSHSISVVKMILDAAEWQSGLAATPRLNTATGAWRPGRHLVPIVGRCSASPSAGTAAAHNDAVRRACPMTP